MFIRWQTRKNRKGGERWYAALCSTEWVEGKAKSRYLGALGSIGAEDIRVRAKREIFWREVRTRLQELGIEERQRGKFEESIAQRVPRPGDKCLPQHSSNSDEWYTPQEWTDRARDVLGAIDLDPASSEVAQAWIQATNYYTIQDDGLNKPWRGRMWLNPPYSQAKPWVNKLIASYDAGDVTQAIILVKSASDTEWFYPLAQRFCRAERRGRIAFLNEKGKKHRSSPTGHIFFYLGDNHERFCNVFGAAKCNLAFPTGFPERSRSELYTKGVVYTQGST